MISYTNEVQTIEVLNVLGESMVQMKLTPFSPVQIELEGEGIYFIRMLNHPEMNPLKVIVE